MDTYVECLVKRRTDSLGTLLKVLIVLAAVVLGVGAFLVLGALGLAPFGVLALGLCIWGAYMIVKRMELEFEYIVTNFDMDVDAIIAQKKRRRMLSIDLHRVEQFAPYDEAHSRQLENVSVNKRMNCSTRVDGEIWYLLFEHAKNGRSLLLFSPDERVRQAIQKANPRAAL